MVRQEQEQQLNQITINNNKKTFSVHVRKQTKCKYANISTGKKKQERKEEEEEMVTVAEKKEATNEQTHDDHCITNKCRIDEKETRTHIDTIYDRARKYILSQCFSCRWQPFVHTNHVK